LKIKEKRKKKESELSELLSSDGYNKISSVPIGRSGRDELKKEKQENSTIDERRSFG
jgi:hypothetical protein